MGLLARTCPPFDLLVSGDPGSLLARAQAAAAAQGVTLTGDRTAGDFSGSAGGFAIKGRYTASGPVLTITITDKPPVVPCGLIERKIRDAFAGL